MLLTDADNRMLDGADGDAVQQAMSHLVNFGEAIDAEELVDVDSCHLLIDWLLTRDGGLQLYQKFADLGATFKVHTTVEPIGFDATQFDDFQLPGEFFEKQVIINNDIKRMKGILTFSNQFHFNTNQPKFRDNLAWTEGNAAGYANSVVGARGNRESTISSFFAAITGRLPKYGLLCPENRAAQIVLYVEDDVVRWLLDSSRGGTSSSYSLLGMVLGDMAFDRIPAIVNLPRMNNEQLKNFYSMTSPALTTALAHVVGSTPEATTLEEACGGNVPDHLERRMVTMEEVEAARETLSNAPTNKIDAILIGCPFKHVYELQEIAEMLQGRQVKSDVDFVIYTDRSVMAQAEASGVRRKIERSGVKLYQDACPVMVPYRRMHDRQKVFATDSVKMIRLIRGAGNPCWYFGSLDELIDAAETGYFVPKS